MALTTNQLNLIKLYLASFNRAPEKGGLDYWSAQLTAGKSFSSVVSTIFSLDIVKVVYPDVLPDDAFLTQIYINVFNKLPDAEGLAYWMGKLALGAQRSALVMDIMTAGLGSPDGTPGKAFIANRYEAAQYAVNVQLGQNASFNVNTLKTIMSTVSADPASVQAADAAIDAIQTGGLDGPLNPLSIASLTNGYLNAAAKSAGVSVVVDLSGTNAVANDTVLMLINDALFPTSITYILTATDIKAGKATVKIPSTADWGLDGAKTLSVKIADVPAGHISGAGGNLTVVLDTAAPVAPSVPIATLVAAEATNGVNAAEKAAGVSVIVSLSGTSAAAGDSVQVLLGGLTFSVPVTRTLTAADVTAGSVTLAIPTNVTWGADGNKILTAKITDAAGNVSTAGGTLSLNIDTVAPTLSSSSPTDNATSVSASASLVLTFSEAIAAGTGNIIVSDGASDVRTIAVTDTTQVTIAGKIVTIKPTLALHASTAYNIQMAAGVITDVAGNNYAGISSATTLNFTTSALPTYTVAQATTAFAADPAVQYILGDTSANLVTDAATNGGAGTYVTGRNVVFTDAPTIAQLTAVDAATTGTLTYTSVSDTAASLVTNTGSYVKAATNVTVTTTASIAQLTTIDATNTTGALTYASGVSDTSANLVSNTGNYVKANTNVIVTDSATIAQLTIIDAVNTSGTLTFASGVVDTAANLTTDAALNGGAGKYVAGHNVVFTNAATIAQLTAVDAATTGTLTYANGVTDTAASLTTDAATNGGTGTYVAGHDVTVTNAATIAQLTAIDAATTGNLTYTAITDTAAGLSSNTGGYVKATINVTVTNAATIAELTTIDTANTTGTLSYAVGVSDTAANLFTNTGGYVKAVTNVTVTDAATIAQLTSIDATNTTGTLTYTAVSDTAAALYHGAAADSYIKSGTNVTVTTAATLAALTAIDTANGGGTLTYSAVTDTFANVKAATGLTTGATVTAQVTDTGVTTGVGYTDAGVAGLDDGDTFAIGSGNTINLATVGLNTGDIFSFTGAQTLAYQATAAGLVGDGEYMTIRGTWAANVFTVNSSTGTDTLVLFDNDPTAGAGTSGIVLIGVTSVTTGSDMITL
jgi:methionine-rich copper-binding protein CopC